MSVIITPDGLTLIVGGSGGLSAEVRDSSNAVLPASGVRWSSLNALVASVASGGTVTGVAVGSTRVIAAYGAEADTVDVLVVNSMTLEIVPASASVQVGGTTVFNVIARNAAGQVITTAPALWTSGNSAVGVVVGGVAVGVSVGSTSITASVGSVSSAPALLTVGAAGLACDGVAMTSGWNVSLEYTYSAALTNGNNEQLAVGHSGNVTAILLPLGGVLPANSWEGSLAGSVTMNDRNRHLNSNPVVVETLVGTGAPVTGTGRSVFRLSVDDTNCTYSFAVSPFVHITRTITGTPTTIETGDIALGTLQASDVLGSWRALGLAGLDASLDAHFIIAAGRLGRDTYYPFGVGQLLWANNGSINAAQGAAVVDYAITKR